MSEGAAQVGSGRELYVRHALLNGRSVALLRVVEIDDLCVVEAEAWPSQSESDEPVVTGPYTFPSAVEATRFVTHAVEALMALGCEVRAS